MPAIITLTTDFGADSPYVAQMKASIYAVSPATTIVDVTHSIPPQDVMSGAMVLADTAFHFPPGTVHVAVVDPGVGTQRGIVAACIDQQWFVSPDNGLLTAVEEDRKISELRAVENERLWREAISHTFHGRDIMAPVAAHLASGVDPQQIGPLHAKLTRLPWSSPKVGDRQVEGEVVFIDSFGNALTNIRRRHVEKLSDTATDFSVTCCDHVLVCLSKTYGESPPQTPVALLGSSDRLEIALVNGSAARTLGISVGQKVVLNAASSTT